MTSAKNLIVVLFLTVGVLHACDQATENAGRATKQDVSSLLEKLSGNDIEQIGEAAEALIAMGKPAVPALVTALKEEKDPARRGFVVRILGQIGPAAKEASSALTALLNDASEDSLSVATALGLVDPDSKAWLPVLVAGLGDEKDMTRMSAAHGLREIGSAAKDAVPALIDAMKDKSPLVKDYATMALGEIGTASEKTVPTLIVAMLEKEGATRQAATKALGTIGQEAKAAIPSLLVLMKGDDEYMQLYAATALSKIDPKATQAIPTLIRLLKEYGVDFVAARELGEMGPKAKQAIPALVVALGADSSQVKAAAALALYKIDPAEKKRAIPTLIFVLNEESGTSRFDAATALGEIGPDAKAAVADLTKASKSDDELLRDIALEALAKINAKN